MKDSFPGLFGGAMSSRGLLGAIFVVFASACSPVFRSAEADTALARDIGAGDARLHFTGRVDWRDPAHPTMSFPGCEMIARFDGTGLEVRMSTTGGDRVLLIVDGRPMTTLVLSQTPKVYPVASGLAAGEHTVIVCKDSEAYQGTVRIFGVHLAPGGRLLPAPRASRHIEFIGDSITCGYGDLASSQNEHFSGANSSWYVAYAAITSRTFGAEASTVAVSGIRLTLGSKGEASPTVYRRTHLLDPSAAWDFSKETAAPDVVVIDLGTNDFFRGPPDEKTWTDTYSKYLDFIRSKRPDAQIIVAEGSMMPAGPNLDHLRAWNAAVVAQRVAAGDKKIRTLTFPTQLPEDGYGADWHPSKITQRKMADRLIAAIHEATGWTAR